MENIWWFAAGLLAMTLLAILVQRQAGVRLGAQPLVAVIRAAVQLAVIALILRGVLALPWLVLAFVVLMLSTASWTSFSRLKGIPDARKAVVTGIFVGA
nr:ABC transporter permease [Kocuria atrinae]